MYRKLWSTDILHDNIQDEKYVHDLFTHFSSMYSDDWPTSFSGIDILNDPEHYVTLFDKLKTFVTDKVRKYHQDVFQIGDFKGIRFKTHATNHFRIGAHQHSGSTVSGIFYVQVPDGELRLFDPRSNAIRGYPIPFHSYFKEYTISPKNGDIVMFPSYLQHEVSDNNSKMARICLPFDCFYDDDFLDNNLQN